MVHQECLLPAFACKTWCFNNIRACQCKTPYLHPNYPVLLITTRKRCTAPVTPSVFGHLQCLNKQAGNAGRAGMTLPPSPSSSSCGLHRTPGSSAFANGITNHVYFRGTEKGDCVDSPELRVTSKGCCSTWEGYYQV